MTTTVHESQIETPGKDDLNFKLDEALERYLNTLDVYQQAQQKLTSHLSAGYFSLAQANFSNAARARYGPDYYDERMQALRVVTTTELVSKVSKLTFSVGVVSAPDEPTDSDTGSGMAAVIDDDSTDPNLDAVPACFETATKSPDGRTESINDTSSKHPLPPPDPIRWFGILVPPTLRSAQASFVSAVEGPLPQLANLARDLRQQEIDIGRLRKQLKKL